MPKDVIAEQKRKRKENLFLVNSILRDEDIKSIEDLAEHTLISRHTLYRYSGLKLIYFPPKKRGKPKGVYGVIAQNIELFTFLASEGCPQTEIARMIGAEHRETISEHLRNDPKLYNQWKEKRRFYTRRKD
jgi:hypothetical protein